MAFNVIPLIYLLIGLVAGAFIGYLIGATRERTLPEEDLRLTMASRRQLGMELDL